MDAGKDSRSPRGALAVVAIGLVATLAAALLSADKSGGSTVQLEWATSAPLPDSRPAAIPGGGTIRLLDGEMRVSEDNVNAERVFRASWVLRIDAGSPVGQARVRCKMVGGGAELGRTVNSRGAFPRSTGDYSLTKQDVPGRVGVRFPSQGSEFGSFEMSDVFPVFTALRGTTVSWAPHRTSSHEWQWGLPKGRPSADVDLGIAGFWRTARTPRATLACTLENATGTATVRTAGASG